MEYQRRVFDDLYQSTQSAYQLKNLQNPKINSLYQYNKSAPLYLNQFNSYKNPYRHRFQHQSPSESSRIPSQNLNTGKNISRSITYQHIKDNRDAKEGTKSRNTLLTLLDWIWSILCILGMMFHIYHMTEIYLRFATTTEVIIELEEEFNNPAVGLCFNPIGFRTDDVCPSNSSFSDMLECYDDKILYDMTLHEIMKNLSSGLISRVYNHEDQFGIQTFFKWHACLEINPKRVKGSMANITKGKADAREIFVINFNFSDVSVKYFVIELHDRDLKPRGVYIKTLNLILDDDIKNAFKVGYQGIVINLLPYPFKDECIEYKNLEFESHYHCMDKCVNSKLYAKYKKYHPYLLYRSKYYDENIMFVNITEISYTDYYSSCQTNCPQNCHSKTYNVIPLDDWIRKEKKALQVAVEYLEPNIAITYQPRLGLEDYVIYISSILSLWFGWCIHATPEHFLQKIFRIKKKEVTVNMIE